MGPLINKPNVERINKMFEGAIALDRRSAQASINRPC